MLLAIDAGNTQTVIGLYDLSGPSPQAADDGLIDHWRIATHAERTADEHAADVPGFLAAKRPHWLDDDIEGIAISSGVPRVTADLRRHDRALPRQSARRRSSPASRPACRSSTTTPRRSGADRIANAVAAYDLYGGPTIVVDFGTATTFDAISAKGEYLGGAIVPGIEISMDALFGRAAALRRVELVEPRSVIGQTHGRVDPVGHGLRLRRPGRRHVRPHRGRAGRVHRGRHRRPGRADRARSPSRSSTSSPG